MNLYVWQFIPVLLVTANTSYLSGERRLMFNYDPLSTPTPFEYLGVSPLNDTRAWNDRPQLPNKRLSRDTPASQRKRHLDRYPDQLMTHLDSVCH